MWELTKDQEGKRTYTNRQTGSVCATTMVYVDKEGNSWWNFDDLMNLPYTRNFAATKISSLYALGLSKDDLSNHINSVKTLCKSNDKEKYEKIYAHILDFETKANNATDAIKQMSSLVCVYFLLNDEKIDSFDNNLQIQKMAILEADQDAHGFFLSRQLTATEDYLNRSNLLSQIVSQPLSEMSAPLI
jgi:hypothetical protein